MTRTEERLRNAFADAAQTVAPGTLDPLVTAGPRRRRSAWWIAPVAAAASVGAVVAGTLALRTSPPPSAPQTPAIPMLVSANQIQIPLSSYMPSLPELEIIGRARGVLAGKCLGTYGVSASIGFVGELPPPGVEVSSASVSWLDQKSAVTYGYHPPVSAAEKQAQQMIIESIKELHGGSSVVSKSGNPTSPSSPIQSVFLGTVRSYAGKAVPVGGCNEQSAVALAAGSGASLIGLGNGLPGDLWREAYPRMENDSRVQAATRRWSSCMAAAGFSYRLPVDAQSDSRWGESATGTGVSGQEVAAATADARCRLQANYAGVRMAVLAAYQQELIDKNVTRLQAFKSAISAQVRRAEKVLAGAR